MGVSETAGGPLLGGRAPWVYACEVDDGRTARHLPPCAGCPRFFDRPADWPPLDPDSYCVRKANEYAQRRGA